MGLSCDVPRLRCACRHLAIAYLGSDRPRGGAHRRVDVACRHRDETRLLCGTARRHECLSRRIPDLEQLDRHSGRNRNYLRGGGFSAEIAILIGAWKTYPIAVWLIGVGMVLTAAFTLRALVKSFFGEVRVQTGRVPTDTDWNEKSITLAEKCGACLLMFATLAVGLYPKLLLDRIMPAVEAMRFLK